MATETKTKTAPVEIGAVKVTPSKSEFTERTGRERKPNPLEPAVKTGMDNRGKAYDVAAADKPTADRIATLIRNAAASLNVSVRVQYQPDNKVVKFMVKEGERKTRNKSEDGATDNSEAAS